MPKKWDVVATTGEYQKNGETKKRYQNVGMVIEKDGKFYLKMTSLVTVNDENQPVNFFSLFEPRQNDSAPQRPAPRADDLSGFDDDVGF